MNLRADNRSLLRDYLLGRLDEPRREQAEQFFVDEALFEELMEVESDLLDQYVRDNLNPQERAAFADYLACLPEGREKVESARVLAEVMEEEPAARRIARAIIKFFASWLEWRVWMRTPSFGLAAALFALLVALAVLSFNYLKLRRENQELTTQNRASLEAARQRAQSLEQMLGEQRNQTAKLQDELEQARRRNEEQTRQIVRMQESASSGVSSIIASLIFPAISTLRGRPPDASAKPLELILKPDAGNVLLKVPIKLDEKISSYEAAIQTREPVGAVWEQKRRPFPPTRRELIFKPPARIFTQTDYVLSVILIAERSGLEHQLSYNFTIVK